MSKKAGMYSLNRPGFLLLEAMLFLTGSLVLVSLGLAFFSREKVLMARQLDEAQKAVKSILILELLLEDIAKARRAWLQGPYELWCEVPAVDGESKSFDLVCWTKSHTELIRRHMHEGRRLQSYCFGGVMPQALFTQSTDGHITVDYDGCTVRHIPVGSKQ